MRFPIQAVPAILALSLAVAASGQAPVRVDAPVAPSAILRPALTDVQGVTAGLKISKWKLPGDFRRAAQADVDSIQRDLGGTLPGLLARADSAPGSVPPTFAVYRNLDALYDVLLRVSQTADLGAPSEEAVMIAGSLKRLERARSQLADSILNTSQRHEARLVALETAIRTARSPAASRKETIIVDGPQRKPATKTRHKSTHKKAAPKTQ